MVELRLELNEVSVLFRPRFALRDISLRVSPGETVALWGHNGAGKSTTFRAILDLIPFEGRITVGGLDNRAEGAAARRLIGWVPQDFAPFDLTVERALRFVAELKETSVPPVEEYLRPFGLAGRAREMTAFLSGGERQKLSIALALLGDPPILLLDEPTANLDQPARMDLLKLLQKLKRHGQTMIIATHRLGDVLRVAGRVAILEDGRLSRIVPPAHLVRRRERVIGHSQARDL